MSIEMIFMIIVSFCLLKYKFYKNHVISMIIFLLFGIISELALGTYFNKNGYFFVCQAIRLVGTALDASLYCFEKYLMEKYYYPYWNVAFVPGLLMFIFASILLIYALVDRESDETFVTTFYAYFHTELG